MAGTEIDKATAEAEAEADFADEHDSLSDAGEQRDDPGMEPDEDVPDSVAGMD
jgi:hypothetical protein